MKIASIRRFTRSVIATSLVASGTATVALGASPAAAAAGPPVISEVMFNPAVEDDWEWIELHNPGTDPLDLAGWVVDDINGTAVTAPNIAAGSIPAGGSAILFNVDDVSAADFEAAWGTGINLVPVTGWSAMGLNNTGDTIGLWSSATDHLDDQAVHANAVISVTYDGAIDDGQGSVYLTDLGDQQSWALSTDGLATPVGSSYTAKNEAGNGGTDIGSPGGTFTADGDLLFSQYVEGSSNNKALEIANTTGVDIDLAAYTIERYNNGATDVSGTQALSGTLQDGDVFVVYNGSANADIVAVGDLESTITFYNGDDALVLRNNITTEVVDSIGRVGEDPGSAWTGTGVSTADDTMCRLDSVTSGDAVVDDAFDPSLEWEGKGLDNIDGLGELGCDAPPAPGSVIFTQYVEGSSNNKAMEISNLGTSPVDLSTYDLERYSNGGIVPAVLDLTGTLAPGESYVVANPSANADILAIADLQSGTVSWNGDDAVVLRDGAGNVVDSFGRVGEDPGTAWGTGDTSTVNNTLCRLSTISTGDTVIDDVFDPALEWFGKGEDNIEGLGAVGCSLDPVGDLIFTQYVEGTSNNKAIEIANFTGVPLDLGGYAVEIYANGSATATGTIAPTSGILADGDVFVIANTASNADILAVADQTTGSVNWNGDDAIVLRNVAADAVIDSIGQVGFDPGAGWGDSSISTVNDTLCRARGIGSTDGDTDPTDVFDPAVTWTSLGVDNILGLGQIGCEVIVAPGVVPIHDIQGSGATTPTPGLAVSVEAIVTTLFETNDALSGFFVQEEDADIDTDPATSEGLFVFCDDLCPAAVAPGDLVTVVGTVGEFAGNTQVTASETPSIVSSENPIPTPATISLPAPSGTDQESTFESVEGMLTTIETTLAVSEYFELARFGQIVLTAGGRPYQFTHQSVPSEAGLAAYTAELATRQIVLDDGNDQQNDAVTPTDEPYPFPSPGLSNTDKFRGGDTITGLTGTMRYSFGQWTIVQSPQLYDYTFEPANPFPDTPDDVGGSLTVASFNVLNFFTTVDVTPSSTSGDCGPSGTADCRGGDSQAEVDRQLAKLVTALLGIDADVLGLIELENAASVGGVDPVLGPIVDALNAEAGAGTYDFIDTGFIGTDAIRVALIYKPGTVTPAGAYDILDSSDDPRFVDDRNRPMLTQTFDEVATGERFTVSVNHLKSKGSNCGAGDDATDGSGNCDGTRTRAAEAIVDHLAGDPTGSGDDDFLIIGDLNSYRLEAPIATLEAGGYVDLIKALVGDDAYSYVFDSQLGYLDHALATESLTSQVTGVTEWHINADEISLFDYNDGILDPGEQSFERESDALPIYSVDPARTSDHDPVIIGLQLDSGAPEPAEVLLVVGTVYSNGSPPNGDIPMLSILEGLGANVTLVDDDLVSTSDASDKDLLVVASSVSPSKVGTMFTAAAVPVVSWEGFLFDDLGFNRSGGRRNGETATRQTVLTIVNDTHPISAGYSGAQSVTTKRTKFSYSRPEGDATIIADVGGDAVLFAYEAGADMAGNLSAPARRVGLFPDYFAPAELTSVGTDLITAAFAWALDLSGELPNAAPVVDAGADQTVSSIDPITVLLDATVNDDGRPIPPGDVTVLWTSPDSGVTFGDATSVDTTVDVPGPGEYVLTLTADDSALQGSDTVTITVVDDIPTGVRIAYIAGSTTPPGGDVPVIDHLRAGGAVVTVIDDDDAATTSFASTDLVFVSTSVVPSTIGALFKDSPLPLITTEQYLLDDNMMATSPVGTRTTRTLDITAPGDDLAAGFTDSVQISNSNTAIGFATPAGTADVIATVQGKSVYFAYEAGTTMVGGFSAPADRIFFPGTYGTARVANGNYFALLDAAVVSALA